MKQRLLLLASCLFFLTTFPERPRAQDREFSQFYAAPIMMNPALTGAFDGRYRISLTYRDQWRNLLDQRSTRFSTGVDLRFPVRYGTQRTEDGVGAGFFFTRDKDGNDFNINQFTLSAAYHKSLDKKNRQFLTLGLGLSLSQRSISYEGLSFEDQFDGLNGYTNPSGEILPPNNISYSDLNAGLHYSFTPARSKGLFIGAAIHHINRPQVSFFYDPEADVSPGDDRLDMKIAAHIGGILPLGQSAEIHPRVLFLTQGQHWTFNAGANFRFIFNEYKGNAFHVGAWARPVQDPLNSIYMDAAVALVGIEFNSFLAGFSYDFPISNFSVNQVGSGAIEFSVRYIGKFENENVFCPQF